MQTFELTGIVSVEVRPARLGPAHQSVSFATEGLVVTLAIHRLDEEVHVTLTADEARAIGHALINEAAGHE